MRPIELLLPVLLSVYLLWRGPRPLWTRLLPLAAVLLLLIHLAAEGYRWQMIPLYGFTVVFALRSRLERGTLLVSSSPPRRARLGTAGALLLLAACTALPAVLPVPTIRTPSGPYEVGTRIYELTDNSRSELYSGRDEPRRFQIQVWYPAQVDAGDRRAPWMARAEVYAPVIANYLRMPSFFLDHLALVNVPAYQEPGLMPTEAGYPVILFSHGWNGFNAQNTGQALALASYGYIVVGVQHTYGAVVTVFEDGTIAYNNPSALPREAPLDEYERAARKLVAQWAGDLAYALDHLTAQNQDPSDPFFEALDLSRVGAYGHSTGGGAAIQFCGTDTRCKGLLGMDPFMRPVSLEVLEEGVAQPALFLFSQRWADEVDSRNNQLFRSFIESVPQAEAVLVIEGTNHYDFTDLPLLTPLAPQLGLKGPIRGKLVTSILNDYLLSFFDTTLKGVPTDPLAVQDQKYNEVRVIE